MPKLLLDSASIDDMKAILPTGMVAGVTTNPSLLSKSGWRGKYLDYVKEVSDLVSPFDLHVSFEVLTADPNKVDEEAFSIHSAVARVPHEFDGRASWKPFVKVPITLENLKVIGTLSRRGVNVNATACATYLQAKAARDSGARVVSFFYNRMIDAASTEARLTNKTGSAIALEQISKAADAGIKLICGSIRRVQDIEDCWNAGAEYVTASRKILEESLVHEVTTNSIQQFEKDAKTWLG